MKHLLRKSLPIFFLAALCINLSSCRSGDDDLTKKDPQIQQSDNENGEKTDGNSEESDEPQINPHLGTPLTLEAIGDGEITFVNKATGKVMYKIDNGKTQTIGSNVIKHIPVKAGQKVTLFGNNAAYSFKQYITGSYISSTTDYYAYGNIMSLISSNSYNTETTLTESYTFKGLFANNYNLYSHPTIPLQLPATTLTEHCYDNMFYHCSNLTTAPKLPAKTLVEKCYHFMFYNCKKLNYIECLASGINGDSFDYDSYMFDWVLGVAESGTFIKASDSSWVRSYSGIPQGWTVPGEPENEDVVSDVDRDEDGNLKISSINFPDENFCNYLKTLTPGMDGVFTDEEISKLTDIDISDKGIKSLQGIEFFTALKNLNCDNNQLTELDVTKNTKLERLDCSFNQLTSLDVSENTALWYLACFNNRLTTLDLTKNTELSVLSCNPEVVVTGWPK